MRSRLPLSDAGKALVKAGCEGGLTTELADEPRREEILAHDLIYLSQS